MQKRWKGRSIINFRPYRWFMMLYLFKKVNCDRWFSIDIIDSIARLNNQRMFKWRIWSPLSDQGTNRTNAETHWLPQRMALWVPSIENALISSKIWGSENEDQHFPWLAYISRNSTDRGVLMCFVFSKYDIVLHEFCCVSSSKYTIHLSISTIIHK